MRRFRVFLAHELTTQLRSARFHGVTLVYLIVAIAPAVLAHVVGRRSGSYCGVGLYGSFMDALQPIVTTLFAAALAVDVVARERDENSLLVAAMAPISAAGYVLRRWLALTAIVLPITIVPRIAAFAMAMQAERMLLDPTPLLLGWAVYVAPVVVVVTAYAVGLGTITSRTVLALLLGLAVFTIGLGIANDLLAYTERRFDGPGEFFGIREVGYLVWLVRGYMSASAPTAAGFPLAESIEETVVGGALAVAVAALAIGISCAYLRRTKRDLRPWRIREDHQFRSFLRTLNRFREEFSPDGGLEIPERIAIAVGLLAPIAIVMMLSHRHYQFEALAKERYDAESHGVAPMPTTIVPVSTSLRGRIETDGDYHATATLTLRNDGHSAQRTLAFALNRGVEVASVTASRGTAKQERVWERLGITLDPPLAANETRTINFHLTGAPATHEFNLPAARTFAASWRRYARAMESFDLADLSRSRIVRDTTAERVVLTGPRILPTPRYSPWVVQNEERWRGTAGPQDAFEVEELRPATTLTIDLELPQSFIGVDSCGTIAPARLNSRCTSSTVDYALVAARFDVTTLAGGVRLAYFPTHAALAEKHGPSIATAVDLARKSWPTFSLPKRAVFVERPTYPFEHDSGEWNRTAAMRSLATQGALTALPEPMFIRRKPLEHTTIAAALIAADLERRRPVEANEQPFFRGLYEVIANWRTGGKRLSPVEMAGGVQPLTGAIVAEGSGGWRGPIRLQKVLADLEYRVGPDRLVAGIEDFLAAGPQRGNAKELLDAIGRRGAVSLDRMHRDYFIGTALPRLTLTDVKFTRVAGEWEVTGQLKNVAQGEVVCPLVLRTAYAPARIALTVDGGASVPFVLRTPHEPRTLQLDPERVVYRYAAVGLVESVDYKGES